MTRENRLFKTIRRGPRRCDAQYVKASLRVEFQLVCELDVDTADFSDWYRCVLSNPQFLPGELYLKHAAKTQWSCPVSGQEYRVRRGERQSGTSGTPFRIVFETMVQLANLEVVPIGNVLRRGERGRAVEEPG